MQFHSYFVMPFEDMCSRTLTDRMERRSGFKIAEIFSEEDQKLFWDGTGKDPERVPQYVLPFQRRGKISRSSTGWAEAIPSPQA